TTVRLRVSAVARQVQTSNPSYLSTIFPFLHSLRYPCCHTQPPELHPYRICFQITSHLGSAHAMLRNIVHDYLPAYWSKTWRQTRNKVSTGRSNYIAKKGLRPPRRNGCGNNLFPFRPF